MNVSIKFQIIKTFSFYASVRFNFQFFFSNLHLCDMKIINIYFIMIFPPSLSLLRCLKDERKPQSPEKWPNNYLLHAGLAEVNGRFPLKLMFAVSCMDRMLKSSYDLANCDNVLIFVRIALLMIIST